MAIIVLKLGHFFEFKFLTFFVLHLVITAIKRLQLMQQSRCIQLQSIQVVILAVVIKQRIAIIALKRAQMTTPIQMDHVR